MDGTPPPVDGYVGKERLAGPAAAGGPGQLSVTGFDDSPAARQFRPALTTVRQDVEEKGRAAAAALIAAMRAVADGLPVPAGHLVLPTELVVGDSTRPAP